MMVAGILVPDCSVNFIHYRLILLRSNFSCPLHTRELSICSLSLPEDADNSIPDLKFHAFQRDIFKNRYDVVPAHLAVRLRHQDVVDKLYFLALAVFQVIADHSVLGKLVHGVDELLEVLARECFNPEVCQVKIPLGGLQCVPEAV